MWGAEGDHVGSVFAEKTLQQAFGLDFVASENFFQKLKKPSKTSKEVQKTVYFDDFQKKTENEVFLKFSFFLKKKLELRILKNPQKPNLHKGQKHRFFEVSKGFSKVSEVRSRVLKLF